MRVSANRRYRRRLLVTDTPTRDQFRAVLLGVAIGDALGAPLELLSLESSLARYGCDGVTDLEPWDAHPAGSYTDDTQMTIATALGTLAAVPARTW